MTSLPDRDPPDYVAPGPGDVGVALDGEPKNSSDADNAAVVVPPLHLADGLPPLIDEPGPLADAVTALRGGRGPIAVDAERASGYRYGQRAYLVQLRRSGAATMLIDPTAFADLSSLAAVLGESEWVLHAANQDLPCLAEIGLIPHAGVFDTELAGRLLGLPRVGLAALMEHQLGFSLAKEHSAADWSTRPLPEAWLHYAALDVELLVELRDILDELLIAAGKRDWASEEFAAIVAAPPARPRTDPWRRTSGMHRVRNSRGLAIVRSLWYARDEIAQNRDISPGRILADAAIIEAALALPSDIDALQALGAFRHRGAKRHIATWSRSVSAALALPASELPPLSLPGDGPPPPRVWADRDPVAAARLRKARAGLTAVALSSDLPVENLISPDAVRRVIWKPPTPVTSESVAASLARLGARSWQIELTLPVLLEALAITEPVAIDTGLRPGDTTPTEPSPAVSPPDATSD